jgi:outer membrane murein-binding lipoprotein Lpp
MADKRKAQTPPVPGKRPRATPTIDLTATEVPSSAPEPEPATEPAAEPAAAAAAEEQMATADPVVSAEPVTETPQPEPAAAETAPPQEPPRSEPPPAEEPPSPPPPRPGLAMPFTAGFIGGIIPAAILAALWYGGVLSEPRASDVQPRVGEIEQQVANLRNDIQALQTQAKALQARAAGPQNAAGPALDPKALDELAQRVSKIETAVNNLPAGTTPDPQLGNRIAANESALKSNDAALAKLNNLAEQAAATGSTALRQAEALNTAVNQMGARVDDLARQRPDGVTPAQFEELKKQVSALEQAAQAARKDIESNAAATSASRLALAATILRNAVLSHAPYQPELARAQALGMNAQRLAPLQRFASSGVPGDPQLAAELQKLLPSIAQTVTPQDTSGNFLDRLRANAGRLVRVTPSDAPPGDDPADVLTRLSYEASRNDIGGALRDLQKLPPDAQAKAADWIAAVKARNEALSAARALAGEAANALGK